MSIDPPLGAPDSGRRLISRALRTQRPQLVAACVLYGLHELGEALVPVIVGGAISDGVLSGDLPRIGLWLGILGADFVVLSLSYRFGARASMQAKQRTAHRVREWIVSRALSPSGAPRLAPGELLTRASSDAGRIGALAGVIAQTVASSTALIVAGVLLLWFSVPLGLVILIGTVILLVVVGRAARRLQRTSGDEQRRVAQASALAEDLVRGLRVLKGIGAEETAAGEYGRSSRGALHAALRALGSQSELAGIGALLTGLYLAVIAGTGGLLALGGLLGLGQLVSALGLAQFIMGPLQAVAAFGGSYARARASARRVEEVLLDSVRARGIGRAVHDPGREEADSGREARARPEGSIEFEGVVVADGLPPLTFVAPGGELTGLAVDDSLLASRILGLLAGERDPRDGRMLLDGVPTTDLALSDLRHRVLVSWHDAALFAGSVSENVRLGAAGETAFRDALWAAFAEEVVAALPQGAGTDVGERGVALSGGQRQRVALARALAAQPPVLVLHDPTTAVDAATEDGIAERLRKIRSGVTTIVVGTSPAILSRCDRVVHIAHGRVTVADHASLLGAEPAYRELVAR